ncbi:hypothetical protein OIU74_025760 [Salix koriyanagi]|uniref:Uncharacterized protein n=1 Tax=Salix koriyanagi TaxID=2511006 RepID=A0A9Q0W218_9ROSI|nr:hypothetical protein OIU74_025760 [Salix koriyanagi]
MFRERKWRGWDWRLRLAFFFLLRDKMKHNNHGCGSDPSVYEKRRVCSTLSFPSRDSSKPPCQKLHASFHPIIHLRIIIIAS